MSYLGVVVDAVRRLPPQDVVLEFLAVRCLVGGAVVHLSRHDGHLVGEAWTHLVGHDEDEVGVRNQLNDERTESRFENMIKQVLARN